MINFRNAFSALKARFGLSPEPVVLDALAEAPPAEENVPPAIVLDQPALASDVITLCVPGPWAHAVEFGDQVATLAARYTDAGRLMLDAGDSDGIALELRGADPRLAVAFRIACQGKMDEEMLRVLARHASVAYLRFPADLAAQSERMLKFSRLLERAGGLAVKVETCGVAHNWAQWASLLKGALPGQYAAGVTLVTSADFYYSCGMHNFGLPDYEVSGALDFDSAMHLMNQFNLWRLSALPALSDGHSFSLGKGAPSFKLLRQADPRHAAGAALFNRHGLWRLDPA